VRLDRLVFRSAAAVAISLALLGCGSGSTARPFNPSGFHTVLQDDDLALFNPSQLPGFISELKYLGVDVLRVSAEWKLEAPNPNGATPPPSFNPADPHSYDRSSGMQALDRAVRAARSAGLGVIIDPAFSAPRWATQNTKPKSSPGDPWYNWHISIPELVTWETMLARRYSGRYTPSGAGSPLPRVQFFTLWNGQPVVADWYRQLLREAYPAIKSVNPSAQILIGNTSSTGADPQSGNGGVPPLEFIERMACVNGRLRPIRAAGCANFTMLPADGYSQHPYERDAPPWVAQRGRGFAEMGDLPQLQRLLDRLVAMHRLEPGARHVWLTEQGYGSDNELAGSPWNEAEQAQLNADSEYLAWRSHTESFSQFLLRDTLIAQTKQLRTRTGNVHAFLSGTWTTGLQLQNGTPKPALAMFRSPVVARLIAYARRSSLSVAAPPGVRAVRVEVWGRARPVRRPTPIEIQAFVAGRWRDIEETRTDGSGIFDVRVVLPVVGAGEIRFRWLKGSSWQTSPATIPQLLGGRLKPVASIH
jgi:hypothetical protein